MIYDEDSIYGHPLSVKCWRFLLSLFAFFKFEAAVFFSYTVPLSLGRLGTHHAARLELRNYIPDSWK
jgi:hypothetical protein